jgi:hypothetical protein
MADHKATPEQWAHHERFGDFPLHSALLELRDRIVALEAAGNVQPQTPAAAGGLVERVAAAIDDAPYDESLHQWDEARAAILAVADWLEGIRAYDAGMSARWLREEVERG